MGCSSSKVVIHPDERARDVEGQSALTSATAPGHVHLFGSGIPESVDDVIKTASLERLCADEQKHNSTHTAIPSSDVDVFDFDGPPRASTAEQITRSPSYDPVCVVSSGADLMQTTSKPVPQFTTVSVPSSISSAVSLKYLVDEVVPRTEELAQELGVTDVSAGTFWEWVIRPVSEDAGTAERRHAPPMLSTNYKLFQLVLTVSALILSSLFSVGRP